jgi:ubiquinone/menaquinone biosynthesis C-methylase UbiE
MTISKTFFSLAALPYDLMTRSSVWRAHCREMAARLPLQSTPLRVLDLGCGPANSALAMVREVNADLVGIDLAAGMLRRARRVLHASGGAGRRVLLVRADATHLPLRSRAFDAATGHSFLYLVAEPSEVLAEVRRALRPGGLLILMEPRDGWPGSDLLPLLARSPRFALSVPTWRAMSALHRRYTSASLRLGFEGAGFVEVSVERTLGGLGLLACGRKP